MMYVNDLSADSICDTWCAFFVMKSSYRCSHRGDGDAAAGLSELPAGGGPKVWFCVSEWLDIAGAVKRSGATCGDRLKRGDGRDYCRVVECAPIDRDPEHEEGMTKCFGMGSMALTLASASGPRHGLADCCLRLHFGS